MIKKALALGALCAGALLTEVTVHGYLDIMYKETIPPTLIKKIASTRGTAGADEFRKFTEESCKWIALQDTEIIDMPSIYGYNLKGYLLKAENESKNFVLFAHGYRSDHLGDPANFERYYHEKGFNFMSVDHVTAGDSEGDFLGFDYFESADMLQWINYLISRFGDDINIVIHGVSMGGATVCKMASRLPSQVKAVISDCAYTSAKDIFTKVVGDAGIKKTAPIFLSVINAINRKFAHFDLSQTDVRDSVKNSKAPILFVHGGADDFVPVEMTYELYDICGSEKELFIVDGAYHAQSIITDGDGYKAKIDDFLGKYM